MINDVITHTITIVMVTSATTATTTTATNATAATTTTITAVIFTSTINAIINDERIIITMADDGFWSQNVGFDRTKTIDNQEYTGLEIKMPGAEGYVPISRFQVKKKYKDDIGPRLVIVLDEVAELFQPSGVKTEEGKNEDAMKAEIQMITQSITQLGRSAGVHMVLATQRNGSKIINSTIQSNCIAPDTDVALDIPTKLRQALKLDDNDNNDTTAIITEAATTTPVPAPASVLAPTVA